MICLTFSRKDQPEIQSRFIQAEWDCVPYTGRLIKWDTDGATIEFESDEDATMFKLKWL